MQTYQRVNKLFGKKQQDDQLPKTIVSLMKYFGWTLEDVRKLPIPSFKSICEIVNIIEKEAEEEAKKNQKRR